MFFQQVPTHKDISGFIYLANANLLCCLGVFICTHLGETWSWGGIWYHLFMFMWVRERKLPVRKGASGIICRGELKLLKPSVKRREIQRDRDTRFGGQHKGPKRTYFNSKPAPNKFSAADALVMLIERNREVSLVTELSVSAAWARHIRTSGSARTLCVVHILSPQSYMCHNRRKPFDFESWGEKTDILENIRSKVLTPATESGAVNVCVSLPGRKFFLVFSITFQLISFKLT